SFAACEAVTPSCPVEATTYGYYPVPGANAALAAAFAIFLVAQLVFATITKVYSYSLLVAAGCLVQLLGYVGRLLMHSNPWNRLAMRMQIVCLIIGPTFTAAALYLTVKHTVRLYGSEYSRLRPSLYTWIFIGCDIGSILLQATGGGVAGGGKNKFTIGIGNDIIIAGIAFQVATMAACGVLVGDYLIARSRRATDALDPVPGAVTGVAAAKKAQVFQIAVCFAYTTVLVRCIYRIPEMAGGWGNLKMRNETEFLALDGLMIALASAALTFFHPGYFFPIMK
ncbi:RTA1 like protein, partial [Thozetella sp. PMI_491]